MTGQAVPVVAALVALAAVAQHNVWRVSRTAVTIAHEAGHGLVAVLSGRRLSGIRLHSDTSGLTVSRGRRSGPGMVLTAAAGYLTPSLLGLGAAGLVALGQARLLLGLTVVLLVATLVYVRNLYGGFTTLVTGGVVGAVDWYGTPEVRLAFGAALAWFLLFGGLRAVVELGRSRRRRRWPDSDADQLAALTGIPSAGWVALFGLVAVAALALGGWWLLGDLRMDELGRVIAVARPSAWTTSGDP